MNPDSSSDGKALQSPTRLRDRLREETYRAILGSAEEIFGEEGMGARMERIAARAGVAVGTLYNHFEDRDALVRALSCSRREALMARLDAALAASAGQPIEARLRALLGALAEHGQAHGRYLTALVQSGEGPARLHPSGSLHDELVRRVQAVLEEGLASGQLTPGDAALRAAALVGMARAVLVRAVQGAGGWEALPGAVVDLFLHGVAR
ncbi:MAG: TetR/AcrR family transcriptional regulator [Anaeromyxobacter sp.]